MSTGSSLDSSVPSTSPASILFGFSESENNYSVQISELIQCSKSMGASARLISLIRGVHTKNARLVLLIATYTVDMTDPSLNQKDVLKQFMNEYLRWLDADAIALFNNYATYLPHHMPLTRPLHPATQFAAPIENLLNHIEFVDRVSSTLKTLSICEPLYSILHSLSNIIIDFNAATRQQRLQNIGFGCVQSFVDGSTTELEPISSFFNTLQIILRSEYSQIDLFLRTATNTFDYSVELALLDLTNSKTINALAILEVVEDPYYLRSLLFPPFRLEEFTVKKIEAIDHIIYLQRNLVAEDAVHAEISLKFSNGAIMERWLGHLRQLFSSDFPPPQAFALPTTFSNESLSSIGLGINMHETSTQHSNLSLDDFTPPSTATLDNFFGPPSIRSMLPLSQLQKRAQGLPMSSHLSMLPVPVDTDFRPRSKSGAQQTAPLATKAGGESDNMITLETPIIGQPRKDSYSSGSSSQIKKVGSNSAESSFYKTQPVNVDINTFGQSHRPSFSLVGVSDVVSSDQPKNDVPTEKKKKGKKGLFSIFKKKKRTQRSPTLPQLLPIKMDVSRQTQEVAVDAESIVSSPDVCDNTDADFTGSRVQQKTSQPDLSTSAIKSTTSLPAAFALPQSTSMTFFKQHVSSDNIALLNTKQGNASNASLAAAEPALIVPDDLKAAINSDDSIDYYISSASPKAMKVSRWKEKYGKWEMLTINERLFLKIVVSHVMKKCWLLIFKEEYDEEDQEEYDAPILIMDIDMKSLSARKTSALDLQICATDSITKVSNLILIRCVTGTLSNTILQRLKGAAQLVVVGDQSCAMTLAHSDSTLVSSFMSSSLDDQSHSPNTTEELPVNGKKSLSATTIEESTLTTMQVRLLKLSALRGDIHDPAAWEILAMYMLELCVVCDLTDNSYYYKFVFNPMAGEDQRVKPHSWLIPESQRDEKLSRIGKAGLLVELDTREIFMIECRGTKEFQQLYECL